MRTILIDCGHGGIDPKTGKYTTPGKRAHHPGQVFHSDGWFYEGVFNRQIGHKVALMLMSADVPVIYVHHEHIDRPLKERVNSANLMHKSTPCLYFSIHANAANTRARGFEIFTSVNASKTSQDIATDIYEGVEELTQYKLPMRKGAGSEKFKRENFYVVRHTVMPAVLVECAFFDNLEDALLLNNCKFQTDMAATFAKVLIKYAKK
jgi:N-acetylmuramoyl-L-alanine amidase